jgi:glutamate-ammonia-ligase adenylyltransferase
MNQLADNSLIRAKQFLQQHAEMLTVDKTFRLQLETVLAASEFFWRNISIKPELFFELIDSGCFNKSSGYEQYSQTLAVQLQGVENQNDLEKRLRQFRQQEMLRLIWRDVLQLASLEEIMLETSHLAEVCILQTAEVLQNWLEARYGQPQTKSGERQRLQIIAMGKLGGQELNLSSDVDLIFCFSEAGFTQSGSRSISNEQFFIKLAQQLSTSLSRVTEDGFVFRVDLRLRPFGQSGALAISLAALGSYFNKSARAWERYAFVKARVLGKQVNTELLNLCRQFVYQQSSDSSLMTVLKGIKEKLQQEVKKKDLQDNIKLGPGGIRELEFVVQVFQLIYGEKDQALRQQNLLETLSSLHEKNHISIELMRQLRAAYLFLRQVENRLQAYNDQQTHSLPTEEKLQNNLAKSMRFLSWSALQERLAEVKAAVVRPFTTVINQSLEDISISKAESIRQSRAERRQAVEAVFTACEQGLSEELLTKLVMTVLNCAESETIAQRVVSLLKVLDKQQLNALADYQLFVSRLVKVAQAGEWLVTELLQKSSLLSELLARSELSLPVDLLGMIKQRDDFLQSNTESSTEVLLAGLNQFKYQMMMRIALADVLEERTVMQVSDLLTDLAIAVMRGLLAKLWAEMTARYGRPRKEDGSLCDQDFVVVAYGKLGGIELSYTSDLDLVFLYDASDATLTSGEKPITGAQFYQRLAAQLIQMLSIPGETGRLYEVDTQLRPMGKAGLLANSFSAYAKYQKEQAWTWEHQALVRARVIAGDQQLAERFSVLRCQVLGRVKNIAELKSAIVSMREKMRSEKISAEEGFSLKQGHGGMVDIEFLAQYVVLAWSSQQPLLLMFPDNIRIFETCESAGLLSRQTVDSLCDAYRTFRKAFHRLALQGKSGLVSDRELRQERKNVLTAWRHILQS